MLVDLFAFILEMSIMGSYVMAVVLLVRLPMLRKHRVCCYLLWLAVLFRLLCPISIETPVSLIPQQMDASQAVSAFSSTVMEDTERFEYGSQEFFDAVYSGEFELIRGEGKQSYILLSSNSLSAPKTIGSCFPAFSIIWIIGGTLIVLAGVVSYIQLRIRLIGAVEKDGYFLADHIPSSFVLGLMFPRIYLPSELPEDKRRYILLHERQHIKRLDHWVKFAAYLALCIHWFNPLVWLMFHLMVKDMEMSCDEAVLSKLGQENRSDYSALLLQLSTGRGFAWSPLAFGSGDVSKRIRNILSWKKPAAWVTVLSLILTATVSVSAVTDPVSADQEHILSRLCNSFVISGTIDRGNSADFPEPLNQSQLSYISDALDHLDEGAVQVIENPAENHLFTVSIRNLNGIYFMHYGYRGGDPVLTLERTGEDPGFWQISDKPLEDLLYHIFLCKGSISVDNKLIPKEMTPYEIYHWGGCYTHLYHYYCPICDQDGVLTTSYACTCGECGGFWAEFSAMIKRHGKAMP